MKTIEIMDTTLREGEQTAGVSFSSHEKIGITRLLIQGLNVNRVEIGSARVSRGEYESAVRLMKWAKEQQVLDRIEILGFLDNGESVEWIDRVGGKVLNLLCKGSRKHLNQQLRKTTDEHIRDITDTVVKAQGLGMDVNIYLEDWSNGMMQDTEYVFELTDALVQLPIKRMMLPDTLGILHAENTFRYCKEMLDRYPNIHFDFHAHNDYDLATANVYAAVKAGIKGIHATINGLGERAGNASMSSVVAVIHDQLKEKTTINESKINLVSKVVETYSGIHISPNKPVIGEFVFTQCAGVHADGDQKNNLYCNELLPERFGRTREYALGKMSGKANILKNLTALGVELDKESMEKVTRRIVELGDKKERLTQEDLPYIISDVLKQENGYNKKVQILNYSLSLAQGLKPIASLKLEIEGEAYEETAMGDGQYDAFMRAVRKIYKRLGRPFPMLTNYSVTIPPGGRTDAFVQTVISWRFNGVEFKTRGLDGDQTEAAIKATLKMLNKIENWEPM